MVAEALPKLNQPPELKAPTRKVSFADEETVINYDRSRSMKHAASKDPSPSQPELQPEPEPESEPQLPLAQNHDAQMHAQAHAPPEPELELEPKVRARSQPDLKSTVTPLETTVHKASSGTD